VGIIFGVVAAVCWGFGDFLITLLTRRIGTSRALVAIQALSLLSWLVLVLVWPAREIAGARLIALVLGTGVCHVLGLFFVYRAFEIGTLAIVSPISAGFAIVTALLSLAMGEHPPALTRAGAALLIGGAVLATRPTAGPGVRSAVWRGVPEAALSALAFGTMFWMFYFFVEPELGHGWPMVVLKTMAVTGSLLLFLQRRRKEPAPAAGSGARIAVLAAGAAAADTLAWLAYIRGTATTYATIVTALASLFSVVTVLLAWRFFRERLSVPQWAGVAAILLGILVVSV
jgi:drug/metabolite transporter (DMT)-like permease